MEYVLDYLLAMLLLHAFITLPIANVGQDKGEATACGLFQDRHHPQRASWRNALPGDTSATVWVNFYASSAHVGIGHRQLTRLQWLWEAPSLAATWTHFLECLAPVHC